MAQQSSEESWTRHTIAQNIHKELQSRKRKQILLDIYVLSDCVTIRSSANSVKLPPTTASMDMLGKAILDLSKMKQYDRIITIQVFGESPITLRWMAPLLSDEFNSLISFYSRHWRMYFASSYNMLCEMIANDKMIAISLGFGAPEKKWNAAGVYDFDKKKFLVNTTKLLNAIKATNTLDQIFINGTKKERDVQSSLCESIHDLLKEALSLNFSVTTLTTGSEYLGRHELTTDYGKGHDMWGIDEETYGKYQQWWPQIKKRNEESQAFNRILVGDQKDDGAWDKHKCPYTLALKLVKSHFPMIPSLYFDKRGDRCFCKKCHLKRKEKRTYSRGNPPRKYALPIEWVRFGLKTDEAKCVMNHVWDQWHVAFHGTPKDVVPKIFGAGLMLSKPGDVILGGDELGIRDGHIGKPFERSNKYSKQKETFDPNQIYMSPSIRYSGHGAYAKWFYCSHAEDSNRALKVQFAFQLRVRPGSYGIGQETVGASRAGLSLDKAFSNDELEWYTKESAGIVLHGLMVHVKEVNVKLKKNKNKDDTEDVKFASQLAQVKQIMALKEDSDERINALLVKHKGDVSGVVESLLTNSKNKNRKRKSMSSEEEMSDEEEEIVILTISDHEPKRKRRKI
eukprot:67205_1